jgi:hypothetical protein
VNAVTVGTDRRLAVPTRERFSVHALVIFAGDRSVTLTARAADVELENARQRIVRRAHVVRVVAIGTHRRARRAFGDGEAMNAFLIRDGRLRAQPGLLHDEFLSVTIRAGFRDLRTLHRRDLVRRAVTVLALCSRPFSGSRRFGVQAVVPRFDCVRMT